MTKPEQADQHLINDHSTAPSSDPIIWRNGLRASLNSVSNETVRRWLKENRLPKSDIFPTRQAMGWKS